MREEIEKMKKEVKEIQEQTFALEILSDYKKQYKRLNLKASDKAKITKEKQNKGRHSER